MKTIIRSILITLACSSSALAAVHHGPQEGSFLKVLFLAFCALIIWCQLLPTVKVFIDTLKRAVDGEHKEAKKQVTH